MAGGASVFERRTSAKLRDWMRETINRVTVSGGTPASRQAKKHELGQALESLDPAHTSGWLKRALGHRNDRPPAPVPIEVVETIAFVCGGDAGVGRQLWHQAGAASRSQSASGADRDQRRPMRGREVEWETFLATAAPVVADRARSAAVLFVGRAGFGKTTMVSNVEAWARSVRADVVSVDVSLPGLAGFERVLEIEPSHANEPQVSGPEYDYALAARMEQIEEALYRRAQAGLTVVVVDDLHRAGGPLRRTVRNLAERSLAEPILLVVASRPDDPDGELACLADQGTVRTVPLGALEPSGVADVVADFAHSLGSGAQTRLAELTYRATSGDPAAVALVLDEHLDGGDWRDGHSIEQLQAGHSQSTVDLWRRRVAALSPEARRVVYVCAVSGAATDLRVLSALPHLASVSDRIATTTDEAVGAGLLIWTDQSASKSRVGFAHDVACDAALSELQQAIAAELHHQIAEQLSGPIGPMAEPDDLTRYAQLFEHRHLAAAVIHKPLALGSAALNFAERALTASDPGQAITVLGCGIDATDSLPSADAAILRARLLRLLGSCPLPWQERKDHLEAARVLVASTDPPDHQLLAAIACDLSYLAPFGREATDIGRALEEVCAQLARTHPALHAAVQARLAAHLVWSSQPTPSLTRADQLSRSALDEAQRTADETALAVARDCRAIVLTALPDLNEMKSVVAGLRDSGASNLLEVAAMARAGDRLAMNRAIETFSSHEATPRWARDAFGCQFRALNAFLDGEIDSVIAEADALVAQGTGDDDLVLSAASAQIWALHLRGDADTARVLTEAAAHEMPDVTGLRAAAALFNTEPGGSRLHAAEIVQSIADDGLGNWGHPFSAVAGMGCLAETVARLEDSTYADALYQALLPFRDQIVVLGLGTVCFGAVDRYLGMLIPHTTAGGFDQATQHFDAAHEVEDALHSSALRAETLYWHGRTLAPFEESSHHEILDILKDALDEVPDQMKPLDRAIRRRISHTEARGRRAGPN